MPLTGDLLQANAAWRSPRPCCKPLSSAMRASEDPLLHQRVNSSDVSESWRFAIHLPMRSME